MVDIGVSAAHKMQAEPTNRIEQQPDIKTAWNRKVIIVNDRTEIIKAQPCNNSYKNVGYNEPADM